MDNRNRNFIQQLCLATALLFCFHSAALAYGFLRQAQMEVKQLDPGQPLEREIAGGQEHTCQIALAEGQYLKIVVEQRGIDVIVQVLGPDGKAIAEIDQDARKQGQETVEQVAEAGGLYRLVVRPRQKDAPAGRYEIRVAELRAA